MGGGADGLEGGTGMGASDGAGAVDDPGSMMRVRASVDVSCVLRRGRG